MKISVPKDAMRSAKLIDGVVWDGRNPAQYADGFKIKALKPSILASPTHTGDHHGQRRIPFPLEPPPAPPQEATKSPILALAQQALQAKTLKNHDDPLR